jgi:hypothetical protein
MSFRNNAYATVWEVTPKTATITSARISTSRKDNETDKYETDFSGFVSFLGTAAASKALSLKKEDRIKLLDVAVTSKYDKEQNKTYTNFNVFDFELATKGDSAQAPRANSPKKEVDSGEVEAEDLPF